MIKSFDTVVLVEDVRSHSLLKGDLGAIVEVYGDGDAYEVEFVRLDGTTAALVTLSSDQIRAVSGTEIPHAREVAA